MAEDKMMRLSLVAKQINVGISTIVQYLSAKGHKVNNDPNTKLNFEQLKLLAKEYRADNLLESLQAAASAPAKPVEEVATPPKKKDDDMPLYFRAGTDAPAVTAKAEDKTKEKSSPEPEKIVGKAEVTFKVLGKIELDEKGMPVSPKPVAAIPAPAPKVEEPPVVESVKEEIKAEPVLVAVPEVPATPAPVAEVKPEPTPAPVPEVKVAVPSPVVVAKEETPAQEVVVEKEVIQETQPKPTIVEEVKPVVEVKKHPESQSDKKAELPKVSDQPKGQQQNQAQHQHPKQNQHNQQHNQHRHQQHPNQQQGQKPNHNHSNQNKSQNPVQQSQQPKPQPKRYDEVPANKDIELIEAKGETLKGLTVLGKIELPVEQSRSNNNKNKKKRKRIKPAEKVTEAEIRNEKGAPRPKKDENQSGGNTSNNNNNNNNNNNKDAKKPHHNNQGGNHQHNNNNNNNNANNNNNNNNKKKPKKEEKEEVSDKQIQEQIKATMARLQGQTNKPSFGAKERREKRKVRAEKEELRQMQEEEAAKTLKVTEFISASELASLMDVSVNDVISTCMSLGMFVSINQRLEADVIVIIAEEFGFEVQFVSAEEEIEAALQEEQDDPATLEFRAPIVTIMGHVDHGKTSLLDYIRRAKVAAGEAGGITQHIGAYSVKQEDGRRITFLDTPGHEAFTAMRARGAKVTDVAIIVIAADDAVMPQTEEAINHAMVAGVPIVFAFSKVDKPGANTDRVREQLAARNILVEEWGGKYQSQEISSKSGLGVNELLEKVLLEAEMLELKANPNKSAVGTVIEASLDKGRGYVANILVQAGTLRVGDMMLAGAHYGRVKAMFDYLGKKLKEAGPATPVQVLGLSGAPAAGDKLNVMENERDAREIANKREQIIREQSLRSRKHITLEEIGRRKAIGTFKELNVIVKGDVDGSVEALSDSLLKLSTEEVQVRIIHKGVGQVSESDVLLASAADAVIVAFQVRPSTNARRLAETEQIEIRTYSVIYQAIDEIRDAMEGLLAPTFEESVTANIEVRNVFKISKVGTVAGCYVLDGNVKRNNKIRIIRDFVVVHEGEISALKRFKDDVSEVKFGYECGLSIKNFNDIQEGDIIECFELKEVKRTL